MNNLFYIYIHLNYIIIHIIYYYHLLIFSNTLLNMIISIILFNLLQMVHLLDIILNIIMHYYNINLMNNFIHNDDLMFYISNYIINLKSFNNPIHILLKNYDNFNLLLYNNFMDNRKYNIINY